MSDFLHNLRSGKFKRHDRSKRQYNDFKNKGSQWRNDTDKRSGSRLSSSVTEQLTTIVNQAVAEIKGVLEDISANQKRLADAYESNVKAFERSADAMESIAELLKQPQGDLESIASPQNSTASEPEAALDREQLIEYILDMRAEGISYEKIALHLNSKEIPTFSGKGTWRGPAVSKICKQIN